MCFVKVKKDRREVAETGEIKNDLVRTNLLNNKFFWSTYPNYALRLTKYEASYEDIEGTLTIGMKYSLDKIVDGEITAKIALHTRRGVYGTVEVLDLSVDNDKNNEVPTRIAFQSLLFLTIENGYQLEINEKSIHLIKHLTETKFKGSYYCEWWAGNNQIVHTWKLPEESEEVMNMFTGEEEEYLIIGKVEER